MVVGTLEIYEISEVLSFGSMEFWKYGLFCLLKWPVL